MEEILANLSDSTILTSILVVLALLLMVLLWIIVSNRKRKCSDIPKRKVETIEEILTEPQPQFAEKKSSLSELLDKMAEDLETQEKTEVLSFEQEQEEKAIISYQELVKTKTVPNNIENKEVSAHDLNTIEVIDIDEDSKSDNISVASDLENRAYNLDDTRKFQTTEFISPVFGRSDKNVSYRTLDRSKLIAELATKEDKVSRVNDYQNKKVNTQPPIKPTNDSIPKLSRIETKRDLEPEKLDFEETYKLNTNVKVEKNKNEEFLSALIAFRKTLE